MYNIKLYKNNIRIFFTICYVLYMEQFKKKQRTAENGDYKQYVDSHRALNIKVISPVRTKE